MLPRRLRLVTPALAALACAAVALLASHVPPAAALIRPAQTIDGPSRDLLELGGVALADDGTGGLVYRKLEDGRSHIFAVQFTGGVWGTPQRVDAGQQFDSTWPRIAAGDGGRLLVVWVQEAGVSSDRLYSATVAPGGRLFGRPSAVDLDVNESTATWPAIAMSAGGQALVAYRVVTNPNPNGNGGLPLGYEGAELRVARWNGQTWSNLGLANRRVDTPVHPPTSQSAPQLGIDRSGNGVVAFVEPDDNLVERIWARRVFGSTLGVPLQASPSLVGGATVGPADQFGLSVGPFSSAAIAYRQQPAGGEPGAPGRILLAQLPEIFADGAGTFAAPLGVGVAGPAQVENPYATVGPKAGARVVYSSSALFAAEADYKGVHDPAQIAPRAPALSPRAVTALGTDDASVTAWRTVTSAGPGIGVLEQPSVGAPRRGTLSVVSGGSAQELFAAGSGLGDALIVFRQGDGAATRIGGSAVDAALSP